MVMEEKDGTASHDQSPNNTASKIPQQENPVEGMNKNPDETGASGGSGSGLTGTENSKRGRARKYDVVDGNALVSASSCLSPCSFKKSRGRPKGSGKLQLLASLGGFAVDTAGGSFTPHVVTVETGQDIIGTILSFSQKGPRSICILSATGVVSNLTICQPSGVFLRYEGRFEILSLTGSFVSSGLSGSHRKNGMLSVLLAHPDGKVFGGGVVGSIIAAGPIQLIVGSFKQDVGKQLRRRSTVVIADPITAIGGHDSCDLTTPTSATQNQNLLTHSTDQNIALQSSQAKPDYTPSLDDV